MHIEDGKMKVRGLPVTEPSPPAERLRVIHDSQQPFSPSPVLAAVAYCLAAVGIFSLLALVLFYTLELTDPPPHIFGPLSDIGGAAWNLLSIPLVIGVGTGLLQVVTGKWILVATAASSGMAAVGSALLVVGVLPFEVATAISMAAVLVQAGWLVAVGMGLRGRPGWQLLGHGGQLIGVGIWLGAGLFAASLLFGWGSPVQVVVMVAGLIPGLLAWIAWPIWVCVLGHRVSIQCQSPTIVTHRGAS